ncbi:uncharacterized protein V6R79_003892 [Siganus canaliculatus]
MHFLGFLVLMLCDSCRAFSFPVDTIIVQVQQWGVVGAQQVMDQVLLNGVSLTGTSEEVDSIVQTMSTESLLPTLISINQTSNLRNYTVLRSRECILEGSQLHWTDRVFFDGEVFLSLDHTDTWTVHVPQAQALKDLWDQEVQRTKLERISLQEGCIKLMREIRLSEQESVLALLIFTGLISVSILLSKKLGLRHPGGVIGSVIHYPKDMAEMSPGKKDNGYRTL